MGACAHCWELASVCDPLGHSAMIWALGGMWPVVGTYRPLDIPFQQRSSLAGLMAIFSVHSVPGRLIQKS